MKYSVKNPKGCHMARQVSQASGRPAPGSTRPWDRAEAGPEILSIGVELEEALGVKVDVGTPQSLRGRLRGEVLAEAVPL